MGDIDEGELDGSIPGLANTNDVRYADFFEPPPKRPSKAKRTRALPKTQPPPEAAAKSSQAEDRDSDMERAMADVRRDLLDSEDELSEEADDLSDASDDSDALPRLSASKSQNKNLSTHEKQRLQIAEEIRRLENLITTIFSQLPRRSIERSRLTSAKLLGFGVIVLLAYSGSLRLVSAKLILPGPGDWSRA